MDKPTIPNSPEPDKPVVKLPTLSTDKDEEFVDEFKSAYVVKDVDRAAKCVIEALSTSSDRQLLAGLIDIVSNLAHTERSYPPSLTRLLCKAVDHSFLRFAYNAANLVNDIATTREDFETAEKYFKVAMAFDEEPALQAAAHVNYCPIIRDGLISGKPDWPAAVAIYETAARMGLVKAMFNAGNVSDWISTAGEGDRAYGAKAAYWFNQVLAHRDSGKPSLDMDEPQELEHVYDSSELALSSCHIDDRFDGSDLELGIALAKKQVAKRSPGALRNLGVGYTRRIAAMTAKPHELPGMNWRLVLEQMDWVFPGGASTNSLGGSGALSSQVDRLTVELLDKTVLPLFVSHDPCLPCFGGEDTLTSIARALVKSNPSGFFLLPRKGIFLDSGGQPYTPIYVYNKGKFGTLALWMAATPEQLLDDVSEGVDFLDERYGSWTCMIPIAVNALDEGFVVAERTQFGQPWVDVGYPWRMPFVEKANLTKLGFKIEN